jgi:hypothetical protein
LVEGCIVLRVTGAGVEMSILPGRGAVAGSEVDGT